MENLLTSLASATVVGAIVTTLLNLLFKSKLEKITSDIKIQSDQISTIFKSKYSWKEQSIAELLGPVNMLFFRTENAFDRLKAENKYLEAKILKESNEKVRDLLLQKSHLIPVELMDDAIKLVEHYDRYIEEFEKVRGGKNPDLETKFVFVGPYGFPFPRKSADRFQEKYKEMWREVYGENQ